MSNDFDLWAPEPGDSDYIAPTLPQRAYASLPSTGELIRIERGVSGYYPEPEYTELATAKMLNDVLGVSMAQAEAMLTGSMFGWACPGANPAAYDENGKLRGAIWACSLKAE